MNAPKAQKGIKMSEEVSFFVHFMAKFEKKNSVKKFRQKIPKNRVENGKKFKNFFKNSKKIGKISDMKLIAKV